MEGKLKTEWIRKWEYNMKQGSQEKSLSFQNIRTACPWKTYLPQQNLQTVPTGGGGEERKKTG